MLRTEQRRSWVRDIKSDLPFPAVPDFEQVVAAHERQLYAVVFRFLGNHEDTLDVVQETFIRAYRGLEGFRGESGVGTWLFRIAMNLSRNRLRDSKRKGRNQSVSLDGLIEQGAAAVTLQSAATPRDAAMGRELEATVLGCLEELPEVYRETFLMRLEGEMEYDAIAAALECPKGTIKSRLNQARKLLAKCLETHEAL